MCHAGIWRGPSGCHACIWRGPSGNAGVWSGLVDVSCWYMEGAYWMCHAGIWSGLIGCVMLVYGGGVPSLMNRIP